ncbi:MAG: 30S ribosomal protein S6 [Defluviitaleaceae bacterium]|nr:30S ribosomal protein S6 [Defluviitaleaceae bacterium]
MNRYELGVIVRADLEEEAFRAEMERVKGFIDRFGGTIEKIDEWGRRKLAYPITKLTEGMYTFITYQAEGNTPKDVEGRMRLQENILRFLTIRLDETETLAAEIKTAEPAEVKQPEKAMPESVEADAETDK